MSSDGEKRVKVQDKRVDFGSAFNCGFQRKFCLKVKLTRCYVAEKKILDNIRCVKGGLNKYILYLDDIWGAKNCVWSDNVNDSLLI